MIFLFALIANSSWYDQKLEGWYYYQESTEHEKEEELSLEEADFLLGEAQLQLHQMRARAILSPTDSHVKEYIREEEKWRNQSSLFAEQWSNVLEKEEGRSE